MATKEQDADTFAVGKPPDATLMEAFAAYSQINSLSDETGDFKNRALLDVANQLSEDLISLPATTLESHVARARFVTSSMGADRVAAKAADTYGDFYDRLMAAVVRDLASEAGVPDSTSPAPDAGSKDWLDWVNQIDEIGFHLTGVSQIMRLVFEEKNGADMSLWHLAESIHNASEALDKITDKITAAHQPGGGA